MPPGHRGIRGVLDNIVSDGMRMAAEVRKKMDEAQREIERNALAGRPAEDSEDEDDDGTYDERKRGTESTSGSARDTDLDLLEGADAMSIRERSEGKNDGVEDTHAPRQSLSAPAERTRRGSRSSSVSKVVEFES